MSETTDHDLMKNRQRLDWVCRGNLGTPLAQFN